MILPGNVVVADHTWKSARVKLIPGVGLFFARRGRGSYVIPHSRACALRARSPPLITTDTYVRRAADARVFNFFPYSARPPLCHRRCTCNTRADVCALSLITSHSASHRARSPIRADANYMLSLLHREPTQTGRHRHCRAARFTRFTRDPRNSDRFSQKSQNNCARSNRESNEK